MRTTDEIIKEYGWDKVWTYSDIKKMINEVRTECIIECAERAEADIDTNLPLGEGMGYGYSVEKQSILKLIGELK